MQDVIGVPDAGARIRPGEYARRTTTEAQGHPAPLTRERAARCVAAAAVEPHQWRRRRRRRGVRRLAAHDGLAARAKRDAPRVAQQVCALARLELSDEGRGHPKGR